MADKKISELTNITGANLADGDELVVVDASESETKAITFGEFKTALDTSTGFVRITGDTMTGDLTFGDNDKAIFGAGSDLQIFHDPDASSGEGSVGSYIKEGGTGDLRIRASNLQLQSSGGERYMTGTENGAATLFYDDASKLATTSTGVDITGTLTSDGLTVDGNVGIGTSSPASAIHVSGSGAEEIRLTRTGGAGRSYSTSIGGSLEYNIRDEDAGINRLSISTAGNVGIGTTSPSVNLHIKGNDGLVIEDDGTTNFFRIQTSNSGDAVFYTGSSGTPTERMRIDSSGQVGIGTSSPQEALSVVGSSASVGGAYVTTSILDDRAYNSTQAGGGITFQAKYNSSGGHTNMAAIQGIKENATDGNYSSALLFTTRASGSSMAERMRIDSSGNLLLGSATYGGYGPLQVGSTSTASTVIQMLSATNGYNTIHFGDATSGTGRYAGYIQYDNNTNAMLLATGSTERMRIDSSGNLLVGVTSANAYALTSGGGMHFNPNSDSTIARSGAGAALIINKSDSDGTAIQFRKSGTTVGSIGYESAGTYIDGETNHSGLSFQAPNITPRYNGSITDDTVHLGSTSNRFKDLYLSGGLRGDTLTFSNLAGSERMRIDSSGNLLVGKTGSAFGTEGVEVRPDALWVTRDSDTPVFFNRETSDGDLISFSKDGSAVGSISSSDSGQTLNLEGNGTSGVRINASNASGYIRFRTAGTERMRIKSDGDVVINKVGAKLFFQNSLGAAPYIQNAGTNNSDLTIAVGGSERMRIDSSGNLLVGTTQTPSEIITGSTYEGLAYQSGDYFVVARSSAPPISANRLTSDGDIMQFRKDGTTVGSIQSRDGNGLIINSENSYDLGLALNGTVAFYLSTTRFYPNSDNFADLGTPSLRFDDIYATNGTIQTSDQNEKQQIASLTDAEITAAKAISKLFKTFKWNDSVVEKGDAARTHSGVIAQEVEQAMTDAGLNAGDYAFFISTTWWETQTEVPAVEADEENGVEAQEAYTRTDTYDTLEEAPEGATERNRKGIRYPQLLSFIGAATEQRLTSIETRLDALEA